VCVAGLVAAWDRKYNWAGQEPTSGAARRSLVPAVRAEEGEGRTRGKPGGLADGPRDGDVV
jgi:hypothetical protein